MFLISLTFSFYIEVTEMGIYGKEINCKGKMVLRISFSPYKTQLVQSYLYFLVDLLN